MKNFVSRKIFAPLLAVSLLLGAAGCGTQTVTSEIVVWEDEDVSSGTSGDSAATDAGSSGTQGSSSSSKTQGGSSSSKTQGGSSSSKVTKPNGNSTTNKNNKNSQVKLPNLGTKGANGKDYSNYNPYAGIEKYKGKTIKFATWIDHSQDDMAQAFEQFPKEYGIKVQSVYCTQSNYVQEVMALISAGNAPDIVVENGNYPSTFQIAQPFSVSGVDLNEPIWDQEHIKAMSANGKVYFVNTLTSTEAKFGGLCIYNEDLLMSNGIKTPGQYYKEGKWTYANMKKVMQQTKALGSDYAGGYIDSAHAFCGNNAPVIKYENGKFINNLTSNEVVEVQKFLTSLGQENLFASADQVANGKAALYIGGAYALKKTGYLRASDGDSFGYTYMPTLKEGQQPTVSGFLRGYGICKGSKNPQAAGMFIRYFLDPENIDLLGDAFFNVKAAQFYYDTITVNKSRKLCTDYAQGIADYSGTWWGYWTRGAESPDQVATMLQSHYNEAQQCVDKANKYLSSLK